MITVSRRSLSATLPRAVGRLFPYIEHFTVECLVIWPVNENETRVDLVLIETLLLFLCKSQLISMRTTS